MLFQLNCDDGPHSRMSLQRTLEAKYRSLFGDEDLAQAFLAMIVFSPANQRGLVRCSHLTVDHVKTSLLRLESFGGKPCVAQVLRTSGTIKSLKPLLHRGKP
ncbi:MAG: Rpp14/Pop5 family protein [Candidatus Bathyarchaeia archaeon]